MIVLPAPSVAALQKAPLALRTQVEVREPVLRLGMLVDLSAMQADLRSDIASLPVLRLPSSSKVVVLDARRLRGRLLAIAPELRSRMPEQAGVVRVISMQRVPAAAPEPTCVTVAEPQAADAVVKASALAAAPCDGPVAHDLWFDARAGVVRARGALKPGQVLRTPPSSAVAGVAPGEVLVLEARVGPVSVQRRVAALQPGRPGQSLFVKTADGAVLSVPYPSATR